MTAPIILLDRDGVINYDSDYYIKSPDEWLPIPGSLEAIARLNQAGYRMVVVTNQSGVARGLYSVEILAEIHEKLARELKRVGGHIEAIYVCPHHPDEHCGCRKPQLGLFRQIQKKYETDLADCFFIGDSLTDIQVAQTLPCKPILVLTSKGQKTLADHPELKTIPHFSDLSEAVTYVLAQN